MLPQLVHIGPFTLYSFGLMVVIGFAAGTYLAAKLARERGQDGEAFVDGAVVMLFAAIIGARLLFVLLNSRQYSQSILEVAAIWRGGMSFHGGAVLGILAGVIYMRRRKLPVLAMADAAAPGLALGYAFGRIGCLLNGCCFGGPTDLPWGMHFPAPALPGQLYHPAQLYASLINLAFVPALIWAYRRPHKAGQVMALYVMAYSVYRFGIESIRKGFTAEVYKFGLTESQLFSVVCLVLAAAWWTWLQRRGHEAPVRTSGTDEGGRRKDEAESLPSAA